MKLTSEELDKLKSMALTQKAEDFSAVVEKLEEANASSEDYGKVFTDEVFKQVFTDTSFRYNSPPKPGTPEFEAHELNVKENEQRMVTWVNRVQPHLGIPSGEYVDCFQKHSSVLTQGSLSADLASYLASSSGKILAIYSTSLEEDAAKQLSRFKGDDLILDSLTELDGSSAAGLAQFRGEELHLRSLKQLLPDAARSLSNAQVDELHLWGLSSIDEEKAEFLSNFHGKTLGLRGISKLDAQTAEALASYNGNHLLLYGLKAIDVESARQLASFSGNLLELSSLDNLDEEVEDALFQFEGYQISIAGETLLKGKDGNFSPVYHG